MDKKSLIITFTGDLCCHNRFESALQNKKEILSDQLKQALTQSDYVIYNFEGSTFGSEPISKKKSSVKNSPLIVPYLKSFCKPILNLANNHIMDYGKNGLTETTNFLSDNIVPGFGTGNSKEIAIKPFIITNSNTIVNIWGVSIDSSQHAQKKIPGTNSIDSLKEIGKSIKSQKKKEINIICLHGGEEYTYYPMPFKRKKIQKIAKKYSPDIIISHHSHTIQGIEKINKTLIFYSLGNFMFDYQSHSSYEGTNYGIIVSFSIQNQTINYTLSGIKINQATAMVDLYDLENLTDLNDRLTLQNYTKTSLQDAYRVVFGDKRNSREIMVTSRKVTSLTKIYSNRLKILWGILTDRYLLSLYFSALKYKMFKK